MRQFNALLAHVQEIAVKQGLQAQVVKLHIALGLECRAQAGQVKLQQFFVQQLVIDTLLYELREVLGVAGAHGFVGHFFAQNFAADGVQQQARRGVGVIGVFFNQCAGSQDGGLVDLVDRHAVIQIAHGFSDDRVGFDLVTQAGARRFDQCLQAVHIECNLLAAVNDMQRSDFRHLVAGLARTL